MGLIEDAALVVIGILLGRFLPGRRKGRPLQKPLQPVCGCRHHYASHDPETGECNVSVRGRPVSYDSLGNPDLCLCRAYDGPVPLPEVYAPEIGG